MGRKGANLEREVQYLLRYIDEKKKFIKDHIGSICKLYGDNNSASEHNDHGYTGTSNPSGAYPPQVDAPKYSNVNVTVNSSADHGGSSSAHGNFHSSSGVDPHSYNVNVNSSANDHGQSSAVANVNAPPPTRSGIQRSAPVTRSDPHSFYGSQNVNVNSSADHGGSSVAHGNVYSSSGVDPHSFGNVNVNSSADYYGQSRAVANVNAPPPTRSGIQRSAPVTRSDPQQGIQKCYQDINNTLQDLDRCLENILAKLS